MQASGCRESDSHRESLTLRVARHPVRPTLKKSLALNAIGLGVLWFLYSGVRTVTADSFGAARDNADRLIAFQDSLGLPSEALFQSWLLDYEWLLRAANVYYFGAHFPSMLLFLLWAMFWKREAMPRVRWALIGSTMTGLVIHLAFPLAPPRMLGLAGFVDTATIFGPDPYALGIAKAANELAAMPSMHVGWALLIAMAVVSLGRTRLRWLIVAHPVITTIVVVITANHYWTDIAAGAVLAVVGWWVAGRFRPVIVVEHEVDDVDWPGEADADGVIVVGEDDEIVLV